MTVDEARDRDDPREQVVTAEQHTVHRPPRPADAQRTPPQVIELIKRLAPDHTNTQIAVEEL